MAKTRKLKITRRNRKTRKQKGGVCPDTGQCRNRMRRCCNTRISGPTCHFKEGINFYNMRAENKNYHDAEMDDRLCGMYSQMQKRGRREKQFVERDSLNRISNVRARGDWTNSGKPTCKRYKNVDEFNAMDSNSGKQGIQQLQRIVNSRNKWADTYLRTADESANGIDCKGCDNNCKSHQGRTNIGQKIINQYVSDNPDVEVGDLVGTLEEPIYPEAVSVAAAESKSSAPTAAASAAAPTSESKLNPHATPFVPARTNGGKRKRKTKKKKKIKRKTRRKRKNHRKRKTRRKKKTKRKY